MASIANVYSFASLFEIGALPLLVVVDGTMVVQGASWEVTVVETRVGFTHLFTLRIALLEAKHFVQLNWETSWHRLGLGWHGDL